MSVVDMIGFSLRPAQAGGKRGKRKGFPFNSASLSSPWFSLWAVGGSPKEPNFIMTFLSILLQLRCLKLNTADKCRLLNCWEFVTY